MNKADTNELTEYWHRETRYVNDKVDDAFKEAQDHAYSLGLKRGKEEATGQSEILWKAICEEAECVVLPGANGGKRLMLTEEMCIRLGTSLGA